VTGRVRCVAHHCSEEESGAENRTVFLSYDDGYVLDAVGRWRFARRDLVIDLTARAAVVAEW
jgi:hypothetical protein